MRSGTGDFIESGARLSPGSLPIRHPDVPAGERIMSIKLLFVLTSHGKMGDTDRTTGFFLPEIAHPYEIFHATGYEMASVSPKGGQPSIDTVDESDRCRRRSWRAPRRWRWSARRCVRPMWTRPRTTRSSSSAGTARCGISPTTRNWRPSRRRSTSGAGSRRRPWRRWSGWRRVPEGIAPRAPLRRTLAEPCPPTHSLLLEPPSDTACRSHCS